MTAGDVYRALWRHKFFIVLMTAVFVGATWYVTSRQTQRYEASTLVRVQERGDTGSGSGSLLAGQTLAQTYAQIVDAGALSPQIKILVAGCNSGKPTRLKAILPVAPIRVRAPNAAATGTQTVTPRAAARRARRVAAARRSLRRTYRIACGSMGVTPRRPAPPRRVSQVHLSSNPVQDLDLVTVAARSRNPRNATIAANAAPWALRAFIRKSGSRTEKIVTVKAATLPTSPVSRQLPLKLAVAAMIGLIFNGALALLFEFFRDRLPEPDQLGRQVGLPVLAVVPTLRLHRAETLASSRPLPESAPNGEGSARSSGPRVGPE